MLIIAPAIADVRRRTPLSWTGADSGGPTVHCMHLREDYKNNATGLHIRAVLSNLTSQITEVTEEWTVVLIAKDFFPTLELPNDRIELTMPRC